MQKQLLPMQKEAVKALISSCEGYKSEYTNEIKEAKAEWDKTLMNTIQPSLKADLTKLLRLA